MEQDTKEQKLESLLTEKWPPSLVKALHDSFNYFVRLKSGICFVIEYAELINEEWVSLHIYNSGGIFSQNAKISSLFEFNRGIQVRVSDIEFIADGN